MAIISLQGHFFSTELLPMSVTVIYIFWLPSSISLTIVLVNKINVFFDDFDPMLLQKLRTSVFCLIHQFFNDWKWLLKYGYIGNQCVHWFFNVNVGFYHLQSFTHGGSCLPCTLRSLSSPLLMHVKNASFDGVSWRYWF